MSEQSEADVCARGPLFVTGDGFDDAGGEFRGGERAKDLRLGEQGIFEGDAGDAVVSFGEQCAGDARRGAAGQGQLLPEWKLREAGHEEFVGKAAKLGRNRGQKAGVDEVRQIKLAEEAKGNKPRCTWMQSQAAADGIFGEPFLVAGEFLEEARGEVFALEKDFEVAEVEAGIFEEGKEDVVIGVVKDGEDGIGGGAAGGFGRDGHGQEKTNR